MSAFRVLSALRVLRGSVFDPFRNSAERRLERRLLAQYEADVADWIGRLDARNHAVAVRLAALPEKIRGFGHVKEEHAAIVQKEREELLARFAGPAAEQPKAA